MLNILFSIIHCKAKLHFKVEKIDMCGYEESPSGKLVNF